MILILILYFLFASTFTLGKAALYYASPFFFIGIRMTFAGLILLAYLLFCKKHLFINKKDYGLFFKIILFHIFFSFTLEFWGLEHVNSAKACLLYNLSPFITAIFSYFLFGERLSKRQISGLVIGFLAFLPVLIAHAPSEEISFNFSFFSIYEIAIIASVISSAYGWIIMKTLLVEGYSYIFVNGIAMLGGGILALIVSFLKEGMPTLKIFPEMVPTSLSFLGMTGGVFVMLSFYTLAMIIIANIICYNLYGYLLSRYSPTFLSFAGFTAPLFGAFLGWFFLQEIITWHFFATVGLVAIGLYLFYKGQ